MQPHHLLNVRLLGFEVLSGNQIGDVLIIIVVLLVSVLTLLLLHALIALGQFAERCKRIRSELVENAGDEFGQFLVLAIAVNGEGVGRNGGVHYSYQTD
jgi:hypothetical protein